MKWLIAMIGYNSPLVQVFSSHTHTLQILTIDAASNQINSFMCCKLWTLIHSLFQPDANSFSCIFSFLCVHNCMLWIKTYDVLKVDQCNAKTLLFNLIKYREKGITTLRIIYRYWIFYHTWIETCFKMLKFSKHEKLSYYQFKL